VTADDRSETPDGGDVAALGVGGTYRRVRRRFTDFLAGIDDGDWEAPVGACPGWEVRDVLAHLVGIVEDALAGRLTGPPPTEQTAAQVERHRAGTPRALLARWDEIAAPFEEVVEAMEAWPAALDVASHEQDVHTALGRRGPRDDPLVPFAAHRLAEGVDVGATVTFVLDGDTVTSVPGPGPDIAVRTTPFEVFRLRLGRRSRDQVAALDWSRDPSDVIDGLFVFGPAAQPLVE